jgi:hypothetical protein
MVAKSLYHHVSSLVWIKSGLDLDPAIACEFVKFSVGKAMDGFGGKPLPNLSFATFDLFAAFGAEVFRQFGERADHIRGVTEMVAKKYFVQQVEHCAGYCPPW